MGTWEDRKRGFVEAADHFVATVSQVGDRWREPGLGDWDLRALVGHTSRALLTVEAYLDRPAESVEIESAADYVLVTRAIASGDEVAERGRAAGAALGEDPAGAVAEIAHRVVGLVERCNGSELVTTIAGGMRLGDYLPARTFELVVHSADIGAACGTTPDVPPLAGAQALGLVAELAIADGRAGELLLAATGRGSLSSGFTVV